ncbi:hypothetical protein EDB83DRAFT_250073 [Lactarius deliciosus]|nr:hypothetical protein EDB83DRAFT_250073 [Lactarius deliciosus]
MRVFRLQNKHSERPPKVSPLTILRRSMWEKAQRRPSKVRPRLISISLSVYDLPAAPPITEVEARVEVVRRQSGREKSGKVAQASSDNDDRLVRIETRPSSIERQREGLGAIQLAQQERKRMLVGMRRHQGFTPSLRSGFSAASSTRPLVPSPLAYSVSTKYAWHGNPYLNVRGPSIDYRRSARVDAGTSGDYLANALPKTLVGRRYTQGQAQGSANSAPNFKMIREMLSRVKRDMEEARTELAAIDDRLAIVCMKLRAICDNLG